MRAFLWAFALLVSGPACAQSPLLMLDTGGHTGVISMIAFTPDGKHLVSAGYDKVVRVWDWQTGQTIRVFRGDVRAGDEGRIFAMTLSPDGRWLATAGQLTTPGGAEQQIRVYDFASGEIAYVLAGHSKKIVALAFSVDGSRLLSGSQDQTAILWDTAGRRRLHLLQGHKAEVTAVGFTRDGTRAITGSVDRTLRLWQLADGRQTATLTGHKEKVYTFAVSPSDGSIVSGSADGELRLWDGRTGRLLRLLGNQRGARVGSLSFSTDGKWLVSTCGGGIACGGQPQYIWDVAKSQAIQGYIRHDNVVFASAFAPNGQYVATAGGDHHEIHIWNPRTAEPTKVLQGSGAPVWATGFSADGGSLALGQTWLTHDPAGGYGPLRHTLTFPGMDRRLGRPEPLGSNTTYLRASVRHGPYSLSHHKGGRYGYDAVLRVAKSGKAIARIERNLDSGYEHRSYAFLPDGKTVISGGNHGYLAAYDLQGRMLGRFVGHEGEVWSVTPSPDGRFLLSGGHDQMARLWNVDTRELIASLFVGLDGEWVMWTPQGYYTGSPGADRIVGWQINKGSDKAADYVGADQLRQHLNRPDIIERAIILGSAEQAVREAPGTSFKLADLLRRPVPRFRILAPASGSTQRGGRTVLTLDIASTPDPIRAIRVQVNGRQVQDLTPQIDSGGFGAGEHMLDVPLANGRNDVRVSLTNGVGEKAETIRLIHSGDGDLDQRGSLHILAIGVNEYKGLGKVCGSPDGESCDLAFSSADARAFADAVESRLGPGHTRVVKRVLVNGGPPSDEPTAANVIDAVELLRQAEENDTVVLFIAGHGKNEGPSYRFLPTNVEWAGTSLRGSTVVPWQILQEAIEAAKGRRLMFVDTCHSGNAYNQRLGNAAYHANIIAYTAARFDQAALEDPSIGHGLFTYSVVEVLNGNGDFLTKRHISTKDLAESVARRVDELAKALRAEQEPQYFKGRDAEDYVLARW